MNETKSGSIHYIPVTAPEQAQENYSLENQQKRCEGITASLGAVFFKEFIDPGKSARTANRPEFQRMLAFCKQNKGRDSVCSCTGFEPFCS